MAKIFLFHNRCYINDVARKFTDAGNSVDEFSDHIWAARQIEENKSAYDAAFFIFPGYTDENANVLNYMSSMLPGTRIMLAALPGEHPKYERKCPNLIHTKINQPANFAEIARGFR